MEGRCQVPDILRIASEMCPDILFPEGGEEIAGFFLIRRATPPILQPIFRGGIFCDLLTLSLHLPRFLQPLGQSLSDKAASSLLSLPSGSVVSLEATKGPQGKYFPPECDSGLHHKALS